MSTAAAETTGRTTRPHRQFDRDLLPFRVLEEIGQILVIADAVAKRVVMNREVYAVGSYVFADRAGVIRVVKESPKAERIIRDEPQCLVGLYAADTKERRRVVLPDAGQILDDLSEHFAGLAP